MHKFEQLHVAKQPDEISQVKYVTLNVSKKKKVQRCLSSGNSLFHMYSTAACIYCHNWWDIFNFPNGVPFRLYYKPSTILSGSTSKS